MNRPGAIGEKTMRRRNDGAQASEAGPFGLDRNLMQARVGISLAEGGHADARFIPAENVDRAVGIIDCQGTIQRQGKELLGLELKRLFRACSDEGKHQYAKQDSNLGPATLHRHEQERTLRSDATLLFPASSRNLPSHPARPRQMLARSMLPLNDHEDVSNPGAQCDCALRLAT
jgi:hypothetical protein